MAKQDNTVNNIVRYMLAQHKGGTEFFDALDASFQDNSIVKSLSSLVTEVIGNTTVKIILSGKFGAFLYGICFVEFYSDPSPEDVVLVNGNLRHGCGVVELTETDIQEGDNFIFLDDSLYKGRTMAAVQAYLKTKGAKLTHTFVVYDGSKPKLDNVHSLYRYYDHH